ncbi:50S ribosomal protein L6 [Candidatus Peregrinibacteria bacterium]|nr:50S ribosomal protein L6 [Candidatus Peregrinibacteria bacterium]
MSRIGKLPVTIPSGVTVSKEASVLIVKGPKGELKLNINPQITVEIKDNEVLVTKENDEGLRKSLHGITRTLINNMVTGVTKGFSKVLEINGVGYKVAVQPKKLVLQLGYSHPIEYPTPAGIEFKVDEEKKNVLTVSGVDKQLVGQVCAEIRAYRPPEPYKGKGIKYMDEHIRRKAGKSAAKAAA